jgi:hypothetical protein
MIPTNSSNSTNGCDSISSNCVIWQGPDISCINLCNGDTVSDVVASLAELVCNLIEDGVTANPNLTGLDISCLNVPGVTPTTLVPVLQAMVNAICAENTGSNPYTLPIMTLPACLVYNDSLGNPVTQLPLDQFATLIANKVCNILTSIVTINTTLNNHNTRITVLEACVLPCTGTTAETQVVPTCIINVGQLTDISVLLLALEVRFCALETAVGLPAAINAAISQGACILSTTPTLANPSVSYGSIPGWNNTPVNLAQSTQNIWAVLCDLYSAVQSIQLNCCPSGCDLVSFGYNTTNVINGVGVISALNFNFQNTTGNGSVLPATFNDCAGSTVITITDSNNVTITSTVSVASLQNSASGVTISLPGLNTYGALTTSVAFCATNGNDTCNDTITKSVAGIVPCPTLVVSGVTETNATITFTNGLGLAPVYTINITNTLTSTVVATYTQNNPGPTVTNTFTTLAAGIPYTASVTIVVGGVTKVCPATVNFTTASSVPVISNVTEINIWFDNSGSMGSTETPLNTMATTLLKDCLGPIYGYDPLVPGSDALYNTRVRVLDMSDPSNPGGGWDYNERFVQCLATPRNFNRATDATVNQVLNLTFADESDVYGATSGAFNNTIITSQYATDIATLRTNFAANPGIKGVAYHVNTGPGSFQAFRGLTQATFVNSGIYTPNANISDLTEFTYELDVVAGALPAYYLTQVTDGLTALGFAVSC